MPRSLALQDMVAPALCLGGELGRARRIGIPQLPGLVQTIRVRYINEGLQIHPIHLHGKRQLVIAKDGSPLPDPHFEDTVLVAPGERIDVLVEATELGAWAFHCHILTLAEGPDGMFGMVTALIIEE